MLYNWVDWIWIPFLVGFLLGGVLVGWICKKMEVL